MAPSSPDVSIVNSTSRLLADLDLNLNRQLLMQNIENMDNEMVMEVPDTPDRVPQNANGGEQIKSSTVRSSRIPSIVYNRARDNGKLSIDIVNNGRLPHEVKQNSDPAVNLDDSPSVSMNANIFRKMMADKVSSGHRPSEQVSSSNARVKLDNDTSIVVDVLASDEKVQSRNKGKMTDPVPIQNIFSRNSFSNNNRHLKKKLTLHGNTSPDLGSAVYFGVGLGKGIDLSCDTKQMPEKLIPRPLQSSNSPRINGHKRLVRNGLISPSNIAKASQAVQSHDNTSTDGNATNCEISLTQNCGVGSISEGIDRMKGKDIIKEFALEEHESDPNIAHRMKGKWVMEAEIEPNNSAKSKGKGVMEGSTPTRDYKVGSNMIDKTKGKGAVQELIPAKDNEHKTIPLSSRSSLSPMEEDNIVGDAFNHLKGVGGWRTTRNRSKKIPSTPSDDIEHPSRRKTSVDHVNNKNRIESEDKMKGVSSESNHLAGRDPSSGPVQSSSSSMHHLDKKNEREIARMKLPKRQRKRSSAHSNYGECSSSAFDDSDITFLWSSGDPSDARSSSNRNTHNYGILNTVIDIDELSPEAIVRSPNTRRMGNDPDETARRQVEADERLARELQEQFYNEFEGVSNGEIDANIAWTLQQEENIQRASFHQRQRVDTRDPSMSHVRRQYPSRSFRSSLLRSANRARGPTSARMAQLRNGFLSQSPVLSSTERIQFPPNMDIEMRMHILEALEAAVGHNDGMAMPGNIFQVQRDFNENDYEMLLALDEHNHQSGASLDQINGLPQSTVQTDNFEEACAICLETPTIGDTIRHLPCLHKFHKDCIDPWLRRKTSCPICKSSIT